jgi:hypothetical protein
MSETPAATKPLTTEYEFHPIANVFPLLIGKEFDDLKEDIRTARKLLYPIALFEGMILDGRNRYNACKDLRIIKPEFVELPASTNPVAYVISANLKRRQLRETQRALVAAKLANFKLGDNQHTGAGVSIDRASQLLNVGVASTNRCRKVLSEGVPELVKLLEKDEIAASVAEKVAKLPKEEQANLVKAGPKAIRKFARTSATTPTPTDKSGEVVDLGDRLLDALKELEPGAAIVAVEKLVQRFRDANFFMEQKKKVA